MISIIDDQLQDIDCGTQMEPFDLNCLGHMVVAWKQKRQGFNSSSVSTEATDNNRMQYPSTPQDFRFFEGISV